MKKRDYIDLIDKTLDAYSTEHILRYFSEVKEKGITEHGFPRLTANLGILIANGKRDSLIPLFCESVNTYSDFL